jgi:phytoene dehydrogenase-like protein
MSGNAMPGNIYQVDAIIIGAGLGGLLAASQLIQRGKRVIILERLNHSGGRFTAKDFHGVQVSTGAVHMVPFGSSGELARMLNDLRIPHRFSDADVFGSFHVHGRQYRAAGLLGVYKFLGPYQFFWFLRLGYLMFFRPVSFEEQHLAFDVWLKRHIPVQRNPELVAFFASIARFALSLELHQVSTGEVVRTTKNMFRYGAPAIVQGGCGELTRRLEQHIRAQGDDILHLSSVVLEILHEHGRVKGVRVLDKAREEEVFYHAPLLVSDIGPRATQALLAGHRITQAQILQKQQPTDTSVPVREAVGLKVHVLSDISLIPHRGIMYCLDTQRIAGIVQPTNSDPTLAPPGKHLLITHQVIQSDNVEEERTLALADLYMLFGGKETFDKHCRVLTMGMYRGEWPVNRVVQGEDAVPRTQLDGLYLVGDAVKPSGYLMVEGVAQSVNRFMNVLDEIDSPPCEGAALPSRLNALRWLWKAPGNGGRV